MKRYLLIIFDVDGTLVETKSGDTFRKTADDWQWLPGRLEKLRELNSQDIHLMIATNQGGVAFDHFKSVDILMELGKMMEEAKVFHSKGLHVCFTHPKATVEIYRGYDANRKPGPGMLIEAMQACMFPINPAKTLMVGDREEDQKAAEAAGCDFMWSHEFFGEGGANQ